MRVSRNGMFPTDIWEFIALTHEFTLATAGKTLTRIGATLAMSSLRTFLAQPLYSSYTYSPEAAAR